MLKIVPDPPPLCDTPQYLEDTLLEALEHAMCGLAVGQQSITFLPKSAATIMLLAVEATRQLVECAVAQVQLGQRRQIYTLH
ncbi:hypothetical protein KSS94_10270 [Pseudomonas fakonensis]|uniref:Uncharacterized protein n=1 Tax=Pseudomonas fakonensis TaxID=2842355 RepID=A0ABX8NAX0_9PSED|nr:hypothetical protein [Pseudomonas fakonensis]QXH53465.1 hypothetical protein KSS94_10270 [Pseudomonas fakonensis]